MKKRKSSVQYITIKPEEIKPGMQIRLHYTIRDLIIPEKEKMKKSKAKAVEKERIQVFEGLVIAKKGKTVQNATFTIRKVSNDVGVEKVILLYSPLIQKIELVKELKVRRAKLGFTKEHHKKLKEKRSGIKVLKKVKKKKESKV